MKLCRCAGECPCTGKRGGVLRHPPAQLRDVAFPLNGVAVVMLDGEVELVALSL